LIATAEAGEVAQPIIGSKGCGLAGKFGYEGIQPLDFCDVSVIICSGKPQRFGDCL
jgi:hypothetical protein